MIVLTARVTTSDAERAAAIGTLRRILEPTRVMSGCCGCDLYQDNENRNRVELLERWENEESLNRHIRSREFRAVLAVVDMSVDQPEVRFDWVTQTQGLGYVEEALHPSEKREHYR
ncbi:MAG: putative quinol monooxygenase [Pseudomonadota bacterium]|nr:putative quinol monooxygenase [Pseudomonadota bacterium]